MEYFTVNEFANKIKMNPQSVRKLIREQRIYAIRLGTGARARYRIAESELERHQIMSMYKTKEE